MAREVELKFDIERGGGARLARSPVLAGVPVRRTRFATLYFDTGDRALRRAGFSLRVRCSGERCVMTIKRKKANGAGLYVRQEWEAEVPGLAVDFDALRRSPLRRWAKRFEELAPQIRAEIERSAWQVRHRGSRVEVVLDRGRIAGGDREARIAELELELIRGRPTALFDLARRFGDAVPLRLGVMSKSERGYALLEGRLGVSAKAEPPAIAPPLTEAVAFAAIAFACLRHYRLNERVLLEREDPEALHQARVALRRLRAAMALFRPTIRGKEEQALRAELRWFARHFGAARDLDLLLARLEAAGADEELVAPLRDARAKAHRRIAGALRSGRARALFLDLALWIETGSWREGPRAAHDLAGFAVARLDKRWRRIERRAEGFDTLSPAQRHALRIAVKAMRYSAEFLAPLVADKAEAQRRDRFIAALRRLQDRLGELNDAWTAELIAEELPARLREAVAAAHPQHESKAALAAASKALAAATEAAGYWRC